MFYFGIRNGPYFTSMGILYKYVVDNWYYVYLCKDCPNGFARIALNGLIFPLNYEIISITEEKNCCFFILNTSTEFSRYFYGWVSAIITFPPYFSFFCLLLTSIIILLTLKKAEHYTGVHFDILASVNVPPPFTALFSVG